MNVKHSIDIEDEFEDEEPEMDPEAEVWDLFYLNLNLLYFRQYLLLCRHSLSGLIFFKLEIIELI